MGVTCQQKGHLEKGKYREYKGDIENDQVGFTVNLRGKRFTRCSMLSMISKIYDPLGLAAWAKSFFKIYVRTTTAGVALCPLPLSRIGKAGKVNSMYWKMWS